MEITQRLAGAVDRDDGAPPPIGIPETWQIASEPRATSGNAKRRFKNLSAACYIVKDRSWLTRVALRITGSREVASYPLSSVGLLQAASELNFAPKMLGGAMVGLQSTVFKEKLKTKLNGVVNYETWVPSPKLLAPAASFFKIYQERARAEGVDPLGYYLGGWGYAYFQLLGEAVEGAKTLDDTKLAAYLHSHAFHDHHG